MVLNTEWAQVEVIDLINDGSGLAFGIIGGRSTGVVVKTILPGGVADRDGRLQSGDHILQIGEVNLRGLGSEQVASVLRQCGVHVRMVVARPVESANSEYQTLNSQAPIVPTKILGDPVELDRHLLENGYTETLSQPPATYANSYIYPGQHTDIQYHTLPTLVDVVKAQSPGDVPSAQSLRSTVPPNMLPLDMALQEPNLPETETYTIELRKDDLGLGITVAGYVCEKEEISGIFVKSVSKGSAADVTRKIKINDRIVEVDGVSVIGHTNHQAVEILRSTSSVVTLKFERYLRGPKFEQLQQAIRANELRPSSPSSPSAASLPKVPLSLVQMSYLGIEPEGESHTSIDFDSAILLEDDTPTNEEQEIVIGCTRKSVQFSIASRESIYDKWRDDYKGAEIVIAEMHKEPNSGLGISLEGTVDVEDGKEVRPHHYIRNILPDGPVGRNGVLQSSDELLEVNGIQLKGMNHLEVVSILKQLPNFVCLVCARYPVPTRVIDTSQHREAFQARKILAGSLQTLISPTSERLVKAKSETSIASSVASEACNGSRSRSLEMIAGLPMWSEQSTLVELNKGDHGLGFSILDYQDPLNPKQTVIVIRSLVPGGVAQADGRLIPGDRLISVNDVNVEHASLDTAVQILKGAPKGPVRIAVAKPIPANDTVSHTSQDTEDDQTCFDDFQECIEEYQECLEVVHICIDEETSFNHSRSSSQLDELGLCYTDVQKNIDNSAFLGHNCLSASKSSLRGSDLDIAAKNLTNAENINKIATDLTLKSNIKVSTSKDNILIKNDSLTQSDKLSNNITQSSEKDGYETCMDESWSDDSKKLQTENKIEGITIKKNEAADLKDQWSDRDNFESNKVQTADLILDLTQIDKIETIDVDEKTPTNTKSNAVSQFFAGISGAPVVNTTLSEPCLTAEHIENHICLDSKRDPDGLKCYDNQADSFETDEFFLVQYPPDTSQEVTKCYSEPNVLEKEATPRTYKRCLYEYYNDYEDCLEAYRIYCENDDAVSNIREEMTDEEIFQDILLPFKCKSAPDIMDSSFVMLTYDPGPNIDRHRRKSAFVDGYPCEQSEGLQMTVIRASDNEYCKQPGSTLNDMLQKHWGSTRTVEVFREENTSLGISIVGGKVDLHASETAETILGIFVKNVVPESPAGKTGQLKTGDRILEVSGIDLREASHEKAVQAIRNAPNPVKFIVQSLLPWSADNEDQEKGIEDNTCSSPPSSPVVSIKVPVLNAKHQVANDVDKSKYSEPVPEVLPTTSEVEVKAPEIVNDVSVTEEVAIPRAASPVYSDEDDEDDEEDVRDLEGRTVSTRGQQIDRASAGNIKRSKEEINADPEEEDEFGYTTNKVKKKYAHLGHAVSVVQLERTSGGLGLSLAGHKDRNCMAVFVCGINPAGAAHKAGLIQVGDEILEVNGVVLHGRCHLNASAIIKGLSGPIFKVIILRRKTAIDDIAVKPITQFPVSLAEEASEEHFSASYPNVRTVAIKKGNQSLGIMIIEGKHAEVGQGIFISDIQEGSSAEKAGLEIGEMILAVNKDSLVGSNYDTAATLLKRTEGLVTLVVSNPGRKDREKESPGTPGTLTVDGSRTPTTLKPVAPPSRPATPVPEPPADPATCQLVPGRDTNIEIVTDNKGLGIYFIGGKDTLISNGIVIVEVYPGGSADKDGRLQPGDQLIDVNATPFKDVSYTTASQAIRQTLPKMKMIVYRPEHIEYTTLDVDLVKKTGKGLGLSVIARKSGKGVYIADILSGGIADVDGRIMKGDLLISVNGQTVENASGEEVGIILKTVVGKVSLKLHRYKPIAR